MATRYDDADRIVRQTTGADVDELLGDGGISEVAIDYTLRGTVLKIGGSYGPLLIGETRDADGHTSGRKYADVASTTALYRYDPRRRPSAYTLSRATAGPWANGGGYVPPAGAPSTLQRVLLDASFGYDSVGNLTSVGDKRTPEEWPAGFGPVARAMQYDGFDHVSRVDYTYLGANSWTDPLASERASGRSPVPSTVAANRVNWQTFEHDWLGNLKASGDDASLFYDRSLGEVAHGTLTEGPNQIRSAGPNLTATHDDAGNLVDVVVKRPGMCTDAAGCIQRFHYDWDEVGQLARARRWDFASVETLVAPPVEPPGNPASDLRYLYDDAGGRTSARPHGAAILDAPHASPNRRSPPLHTRVSRVTHFPAPVGATMRTRHTPRATAASTRSIALS